MRGLHTFRNIKLYRTKVGRKRWQDSSQNAKVVDRDAFSIRIQKTITNYKWGHELKVQGMSPLSKGKGGALGSR